MKATLKALLITAGAVMATTVAQANTATLSDGPQSFTVTSSDSAVVGGFDYTYALSTTSRNPVGIDSFTVFGVDVAGLSVLLPATGWSSSINGGIFNNVSWNSHNAQIDNIPLTFEFFSPFAPIIGTAGALDGGTYSETSGTVLVPGAPSVPDGGLTATLLGGALLGLGTLRRKLGC